MTRSGVAHQVTLTGYFGLLVLLVSWNAWLAPPQRFPVALVLIVLVVPLLFPLRGLLYGKIYTHAWTSFLSLLYFALGIGVVVSEPEERLLGALEIAFSTMLYTGSILYVRFRSREFRNSGRAD